MPIGYYLVVGDKTSCGGIILAGELTNKLMGKPLAREGDLVTCGVERSKVFTVSGGIPHDQVNGKKLAGTLHSRSSCPCQARFIASTTAKTYLKPSSIESLTLQAEPATATPEKGKKPLSDFARQHDIDAGDLVYGLAKAREILITKTYPEFLTDEYPAALMMDFYTNQISRTVTYSNDLEPLLELYSKKKLHAIASSLQVPDNLDEIVKFDPRSDYFPLWDNYFATGKRKPKFDVANIYKDNSDPKKWGKDIYCGLYCEHFEELGFLPSLMAKRSSKLGLEMTADEQATHKVHFILDRLDLKKVVSKQGNYGQSVTASELRYVYRNYERLLGRLFFYRNGNNVPPPWLSDPGLWSEYIDHYDRKKKKQSYLTRIKLFFKGKPVNSSLPSTS
ncbi:PAAR domain-containing protein [Serratia microhaemolytica]|uniref:PAAR domain-containing protein n=1 Tax=Serratia microhaemolytica TaxID=2675110 RepID=UPI000FDD89F5|nr:PAAR domain-containing protein [Serratia microhaemolytica]